MSQIKSESEYNKALRRLDVIYKAAPKTPESIELIQLVDSIQNYEKKHHIVPEPHEMHETCVACHGFGMCKGSECWGCNGTGYIVEN